MTSAFAQWEKDSWERRATAYARSLGDLTRSSIDPLLDAADVGLGTRLVDVGTGPGFVAAAAAGRGAVVTAVDQSAAMVEIARTSGVAAVCAPADALPVGDASTDVVVASYLLNHLAAPEFAVREFARVLRSGGRFVATVWDRPELNAVTGLVGEVATGLGLTADIPAGPESTRFADEQHVRTLLDGWREVTVTRLRWQLRVEPELWFDALAAATPRTGAVLAQASEADRTTARQHYVAVARRRHGGSGDEVVLPAAAVLIRAVR